MASRYISRRERTTQLVVGGSACAAVIAWYFWADIQKRFLQPRLTSLKPTFKNKLPASQVKEWDVYAKSPEGIRAGAIAAIQDNIAGGVPLEDIRTVIRESYGYNNDQFNQALTLAVKPV